MTQTTLYYREGSSDKVYQAFIETNAEGCHVRFAYGRRGSTLATGTKTAHPVTLDKAVAIYEKLPSARNSPRATSPAKKKECIPRQ